MNTESRGQSIQNEPKDKACQMLVNIADQQTLRPHEATNVSLVFRECEFTGNSAFPCGKRCARVAGVIIKHVRVLAMFSPMVGSATMAARQKVHARPGNGSHYFKNFSARRG
jgi:hypothetical protein